MRHLMRGRPRGSAVLHGFRRQGGLDPLDSADANAKIGGYLAHTASTPRQCLSDSGFNPAVYPRQLVDTIEKAPVQEIEAVIKNLRTELDALMNLVNKASSVRRL
jgi:hypothetical protein